ncbi:hypothetical protein GUJ93_ZPchr0007g3276 [Zizania palustris]|uniref:NAD-dependent epimerase/dehydratase domain-containing protein n=1 Tax=Zizania palustris TaxID=103762 RepID=A0A8J5SKZ3_ZIZPA|nr:hypothetical protein GUJ93_ZPchr0007g3276 [Zizania palustris]
MLFDFSQRTRARRSTWKLLTAPARGSGCSRWTSSTPLPSLGRSTASTASSTWPPPSYCTRLKTPRRRFFLHTTTYADHAIARRRLTHASATAFTQGELLRPAVSGALNVLRAAKDCGVSRVVMVSSQTTNVPNPEWPADKLIDDDCWADVELLKKNQHWYNVSKTLAEKAAWEFAAKEGGLQLVVLNPGLVLGPMLTPSPTASLRLLMQILGGQRIIGMDDFYVGCVDVRDVALSLIVLYEDPSAQGRHLCLESFERLNPGGQTRLGGEIEGCLQEVNWFGCTVHSIRQNHQGHRGLLEEKTIYLACELNI